jgi:hypothetical protein
MYGVMSCQVPIFNSTNQRRAYHFNTITHQILLSDWLIYLTVLHMIGRLMMNARLHDVTPNRMLLDVCVSPKIKNRKIYKKHLILFRFVLCFVIKNHANTEEYVAHQ